MADSEAELQEKWWQGWWQADWSWAGLANKPVANGAIIDGGAHPETDLQAYWQRNLLTGEIRDDTAMRAAGELVQGPDQAWWHLAHVPMHWRDDTSAKAGWDAGKRKTLAGIIKARAAAAAETAVDCRCNAEGQDRRAQLSGAVLLAPPALPGGKDSALHLVCDDAFLGGWDVRNQRFGTGFRAVAALFPNEATARDTFRASANFDGAHFEGRCRFHAAQFAGGARFNCTTFVGSADFFAARFVGAASFEKAEFQNQTTFNSTHFTEPAIFDDARFYGNADFDASDFSSIVRFRSTMWGGPGGASGGAGVGKDGKFGVSFRNRNFRDVAIFERAKFQTSIDFTASVFHRLADFSHAAWPQRQPDHQSIFSEATFKETVRFDGERVPFAAFDGATFTGPVQLGISDEEAERTQFSAELTDAISHGTDTTLAPRTPSARIAAWMVGFHPLPATLSARIASRIAGLKASAPKRQTGLQQLERGCRVLKQAMDKASDKTREQRFYAFELIARRHQRDTPPWERFFSHAYAITADYGRSIARPLGLLLATIPTFACLYWLLCNTGTEANWSVAYQYLTFSLGRAFPIGLAQATGNEFQKLILGNGDTAWSFAIRLLAIAQSLLALVLAFLAGLALRRRFHIS